MANLQVSAKTTVLGCPIEAGYVKGDTESTIIVYGKADNPIENTLTEVLDEFTDAFVADDISGSLPLLDTITNALNEVTCSLNQVYYKTSFDNNTPTPTQAPPVNGEYALWIDLDLSQLTDNWPVPVESVSIKVWETENSIVLDDMNISVMQQLLNDV